MSIKSHGNHIQLIYSQFTNIPCFLIVWQYRCTDIIHVLSSSKHDLSSQARWQIRGEIGSYRALRLGLLKRKCQKGPKSRHTCHWSKWEPRSIPTSCAPRGQDKLPQRNWWQKYIQPQWRGPMQWSPLRIRNGKWIWSNSLRSEL